jgi:uncharacterized membrane protein
MAVDDRAGRIPRAASTPHADNPSTRLKRARVLVLAAAGLAIASYLTAFQLGIVATMWDPIFDGGSVHVLRSWLSRMLPVPDASLGALGYVADLVLTSIGGEDRWRTFPFVVLVLGVVVTGMAAVSILLVIFQAFVLRSYCTLCLVSAALSLVIFRLAWKEVSATLWRPWQAAS